MASDHVFSISDYGAIPDGTTDSTDSIRSAIRACVDAGGGVVEIPPGTYKAGAFELFSNITLVLSAGATLRASSAISDYPLVHLSEESPHAGLIRAVGAKHISIVGHGCIDLRGTDFMDLTQTHDGPDYDRSFTRQGVNYRPPGSEPLEDGPVLPLERPGDSIQFMDCEDVVLKDIRILHAPNWTVRFGGCHQVHVSDITIENDPRIPNSDGIHCTNCTQVLIHGCRISAGDDAIAISGLGRFGTETRGVIVSHCVLHSRSAGIRVGYGPSPISQCIFSDLVISSNRGVGLFARDPADIEDVTFRNLIIDSRLHRGHWWGHGEPIHLSSVPRAPDTTPGAIRRVRFENVLCHADSGIVCYASDPGGLSDIVFSHVTVQLRRSPIGAEYGGNLDLRPAFPLSRAIFAEDDTGFLAKHVRDLGIEALTVDCDRRQEVSPYFRDALRVEDSQGVRIRGLTLNNTPGGSVFSAAIVRSTQVELDDVRTGASIEGGGSGPVTNG